ncbi:MAG: tetratricopeptide repeat protein [Bacteroidota bacterium]
MNTKYAILLIAMLLGLMACSQSKTGAPAQTGDKATLEQEIKALETALREQTSSKLDIAKASELIEKSEAYVKAYPKDKNSASLLFRAADVARGIGKYGKAINLWEKVYEEYPDYHRAPDSRFLIGFTYENNLNEKTQAKKHYNQFLENHPDHQLAEQVKQTLAVIDKSPEELIEEFKKKNKK